MIFSKILLLSFVASVFPAKPIIVLPPFLKLHGENIITILNEKPTNSSLEVSFENGKTKKFEWKSGNVHHEFKFGIDTPDENANVKMRVNGKVELDQMLSIRPDIFNVHIHIDKTVYRKSEIVNVRILPLTHTGSIYRGNLSMSLWNGKGYFESATLKVRSVDENESIISEQLQIPSHTFFGNWKIRVKPVETHSNAHRKQVFEKVFQVQDYDLPNFRLYGYLTDSSDIEDTKITVEGKYFHGKPVSGSVHIMCRDVDSSDRSGDIFVKDGEFVNGIWSQSVNLKNCDPFGASQKEIFVRARENDTGNLQELVLNWDVLAPKFTLTPLRPYFTKDTKSVIILIDGEEIGNGGNVSLLMRCISEDKSKMRTKEMKVSSRIGDVVEMEIPEEWRVTFVVPVIRITAKRFINHGTSNETMLYIPNLSDTTLSSNLLTPKEIKPFYKDGERMEVLIGSMKHQYVIVCNSHNVHMVPFKPRNSILTIDITDTMEGTCILTAFSANQSTTADVMLFRVQNFCEDCSLEISKTKNGATSRLMASDVIEPGDTVELDFHGRPNGIVFYRAMDERLNYITLRNDYMSNEYQDYLIFGENYEGAQLLNLVNNIHVANITHKVCTDAGFILKHNCQQGTGSRSSISRKCVAHVENRCKKDTNVIALSVLNPASSGRKVNVNMAHPPGLDLLFKRRPPPPAPPLPIMSPFRITPELHDTGIERQRPKVRQYFPETWLFDAVFLEKTGSKKITAQSPDNVGQWALNSAFWWNGKVSLYPLSTAYIQSRKNIFLEVILPKNVYVNETIAPKLTVIAIDMKKSREDLVLCLSDLPRKVCADEGSHGEKENAYYMKVVVTKKSPIQAKDRIMKFLAPGLINITVTLRRDDCKKGPILDVVRKEIEVQMRANTETYYERHILNPMKPIVAGMNDDSEKDSRMISFTDERISSAGDRTLTRLRTHVKDTETVYSFKLTLSKFLQSRDYSTLVTMGGRFKRQLQLTNVIKELSIALYKFKKAKSEKGARSDMHLEQKISSLVNEMMMFSNCSNNREPCAYGRFEKPHDNDGASILLTSVATTLLCEADAEDSRVVGSLKTLIDYIPKLGSKDFDEDLSDVIEMTSPVDKKYLLVSFLYQTYKDCAVYKGQLKGMSKAFGTLHKYFYNLDENEVSDGRTAGAIAFMATNATAELMRSNLISKYDPKHVPFWRCDSFSHNNHIRDNTIGDEGRKESCQVMLNSFALSAIVVAYAEGTSVDWDRLADWLSEQERSDGSFGSPLTTFAASRALYEKVRRSVDIEYNSPLEVTISCDGCSRKTINITESPIEINIPSNVREISITSVGRGKAVLSATIVATKSPRNKRGLTQDDYYPVHLSISQRNENSFVRQTVCFNVTNPTIKTLEFFHGTYTLFETSTNNFSFMNSSYSPINLAASSYGLHFIVTNISSNETICYETASREISKSKPAESAPVAIRATHPVQGLVGMILIVHPDVRSPFLKPRKRRQHVGRTSRRRRSIIDESAVDTVCYDGGACSCAETTCNLYCDECSEDTKENVENTLAMDGHFGIKFHITKISSISKNGAGYTVYDGDVKDSKTHTPGVFDQKKVRIWLRNCNTRCNPDQVQLYDDYYVIGHEDGLNFDDGRQNYVLNYKDRFEKSSQACHILNSAITI